MATPHSRPMMRCGHAANATKPGPIGQKPMTTPCCVICAPSPSAYEIDPNPLDLRNRRSACASCKKEVPSDTTLAFFEYRPKDALDSHYCGCHGWD